MARGEPFFRFNREYLAGVLLLVLGAWISHGLLFVVEVLAVTAVLIGVYYVIWRWLKARST